MENGETILDLSFDINYWWLYLMILAIYASDIVTAFYRRKRKNNLF